MKVGLPQRPALPDPLQTKTSAMLSMARHHVAFRPTPVSTHQLNVLKRWATSLGIWGVGTGAAALYLLSVTPLVKREFLVKVPVLGNYFEDTTPASDKSF